MALDKHTEQAYFARRAALIMEMSNFPFTFSFNEKQCKYIRHCYLTFILKGYCDNLSS
jgi:hypothetical protein